MECSPVSLSGCRKESRVQHLLEDGAGIVALSLEVQSTSVERRENQSWSRRRVGILRQLAS
jgi:hypothetical protein